MQAELAELSLPRLAQQGMLCGLGVVEGPCWKYQGDLPWDPPFSRYPSTQFLPHARPGKGTSGLGVKVQMCAKEGGSSSAQTEKLRPRQGWKGGRQDSSPKRGVLPVHRALRSGHLDR